MKTWAPSPLALPLNERGGQRDVGVIFSLPWYLRRGNTLNNTLILVVHQSIRAHSPTRLSPEPALRGSQARAIAAARPRATACGSQGGQDRSLAACWPPTGARRRAPPNRARKRRPDATSDTGPCYGET